MTILENEMLRVTLWEDRPAVRQILHKPSGEELRGADEKGVLLLNGESVLWEDWRVKVSPGNGNPETPNAAYLLSPKGTRLSFRVCFSLEPDALVFRLDGVTDPGEQFRTLDWQDLPLFVRGGDETAFWRLCTSAPDAGSGGKMWAREHGGTIGGAGPEAQPVPAIYGATWNSNICVFAHGNYPLFPFTHQVLPSGEYAVSINTYQYHVRRRVMPSLEARVVFLGDLNGDGRVGPSDYRLWVNRRLPDADALHRKAIIYKILMKLGCTGVVTDLDQSREIIRALHNVTDGAPQIVYLVGMEKGGHDGAYPTLGSYDPDFGEPEDVRRLGRECASDWNTVLSYHTNIDDAYRHSPDWDEDLVVVSGSPGQDALHVHGSMCHTLEVETGDIFRRLEEMFSRRPVTQSLHMDNMRLTNTILHPEWRDGRGIGVLEELVCGLMPVMDWLAARGIVVTTEGYNGLPIDPTLLVDGFWHHDAPDGCRQIFHRKIVGGGRGDHLGNNTVADYGICNAIHRDITYRPISRDALDPEVWKENFYWISGDSLTDCFTTHWGVIVDRIYLGVLLHHFYNEHEMTSWDNHGGGWRIRYAGDVVADVCVESPQSLKVTWGDVIVALDDDRFIPRDGAVYAYSRDGSKREWVLPGELRGRDLDVFTLTKDGRGPAPEHEVMGGGIRLRLAAGVPVKIAVKDGGRGA